MKKYSEKILKYLLVMTCFLTACEKEHLQPDIIETQTQPLVFISAVLGTDTVQLEGGVNSYIGQAWVADSGSYRYFCFYLYNTLSTQPKRCFRIYVNNAAINPGNADADLDSTISTDSLNYQNYSSGFMPSAVTVEWYDSAGTQFSTSAMFQSDHFVITSVEDVSFENIMYKKVTVEFDCVLMDNTFNPIPLTNGRATLLFSASPPNPLRPDASIINIDVN